MGETQSFIKRDCQQTPGNHQEIERHAAALKMKQQKALSTASHLILFISVHFVLMRHCSEIHCAVPPGTGL